MGRITALIILLFLFVLYSCSDIELRTYIERMSDFNGVIYVSIESGRDSNKGLLPYDPMASIQAGIDTASGYIEDDLAESVDVYVAEGTYQILSSAGENIILKEGVSLYGGYSVDFLYRDTELHLTFIEDISVSGESIDTISILEGITQNSILDGFTIQGGSSDTAEGLSRTINIWQSSPIIRNNTIIGGYAPAAGKTAVIVIWDNCSPIVEDNTILGGSSPGQNTGLSIGQDSMGIIQNNNINGGSAGICGGITVWNSDANILDNTIHGGTGLNTNGIDIGGNSSVIIQSNRISGGTSSGNSTGIHYTSENVVISENRISGGRSGNISVGIECNQITFVSIYNNLILGGETAGSGADNAILLIESDGRICNNTIAGGFSDWGAGINLINDSSPFIENNIFFFPFSNIQWCIDEINNNAINASFIRNNNFFDLFGSSIMYRPDSGTDLNTLESVNIYLGYDGGNYSGVPVFADLDGPDDDISTLFDNDWHLTSDSPVEVRQGGRDGAADGWRFSSDMDSVIRTNLINGPNDGPPNTDAEGWSMGAYEFD